MSSRWRVYISGPMAGYPDFNREQFDLAEAIITSFGWEAVNPHGLDHAEGGYIEGVDEEAATVTPAARARYMRRDVAEVAGSDAIAMLPGWEESTGANIELWAAMVCGLEVWEFMEDGNLAVVDDLRPNLWRVLVHVEAVVPHTTLGK